MRRLWQGIIGVFQSIARASRWVLDRPVGRAPKEDPIPTLYHRPLPPRLSWNWWAFILGPFWYLFLGLWVHASILFSLVLLSGGVLIPFVWLYCGLKANEDLLDHLIAKRSYY